MSGQGKSDLTIAKPYAEAVFSFAKKGSSSNKNSFESWEVFLKTAGLMISQQKVNDLLFSPDLTHEQKQDFLWNLISDVNNFNKLDKKLDKDLTNKFENFLKLLFENNRIFVLPSIYNVYKDLLLAEQKQLFVEIYSAKELDSKSLKNILEI